MYFRWCHFSGTSCIFRNGTKNQKQNQAAFFSIGHRVKFAIEAFFTILRGLVCSDIQSLD